MQVLPSLSFENWKARLSCHQAEWDRYYHERQVAKDDALEIQERADGVRR